MKALIVKQRICTDSIHGFFSTIQRLVLPNTHNLSFAIYNQQIMVVPNLDLSACEVLREIEVPDALVESLSSYAAQTSILQEWLFKTL